MHVVFYSYMNVWVYMWTPEQAVSHVLLLFLTLLTWDKVSYWTEIFFIC